MIDSYNLSLIKGISGQEASRKLQAEGYNELPLTRKKSFFTMLFEIIKEPMFIMLIACGSVYLLLGDVSEAVLLLSFVFVIIGITFYQENRTERSLEALRDLSSPRALVIRDGEQKRIPGRDVVTGDIVVLFEGDRVPADAVVLSCNNLMVDESILTGESVSVRKSESTGVKEMGMASPGGDDIPCVYSGTLVVSGMGIARVMATGLNTEMGKIGKSLQKLEHEKTPLQKETRQIVKNFAAGGLFLCMLIVVIYGLTRGRWLEGFLAGITLAMSILPEEFPVVLTVFLALGAWRMSQKNVLTRRQHAIQALGSATVLCVDKTGTLTENKMTVKKIYCGGVFFCPENKKELPETFHELIEFGILSSQKEPFDPMEKALVELSREFLSGTQHLHPNWQLMQEYSLSRNLLAISHVWKSPGKEDYVIAAKGSPESMADLCHMCEDEIKDLNRKAGEMADCGLRVIGVAKASMKKTPLPDSQHDFEFEFLGLLGFEDPVRQGVSDAVKECYSAGIRVVMITGDYSKTAKNIASQIGLSHNGEIITGPELDGMDDSELQKRISSVNIFARVVPEQKLRIVTALKANDEIVAMTGDGVNDAPALKSAHIGIAMGARGTDVARESSSVVLIDDNFSSIVQGVRMGRRIFDNIRKAMAFVLAVHIPIAGITLLAVLSGWPLILLPVHIVFLELLIDPSCSIAFEAEKEEKNIMKKPPRDAKERLFNRKTIVLSVMQGLIILLIIAFIFKFALYSGQTENEARALSFTTLIIANLGLILTNMSWSGTIFSTLKSGNKAMWVILAAAVVFLSAILCIPFLQELFKFSALHSTDFALALGAGIFSVVCFELLKKAICSNNN